MKLRKGHAKELNFQKDEAAVQEKLVSSFSCEGAEFGDNANNFTKVSTAGITVYDSQYTERLRYSGTNIKAAMYVHDSYLYCLADPVVNAPTVMDVTGDAEAIVPNHKFKAAGFYVYDVS